MRIIRGQLKGRKFPYSKKLPVRPTTDFAKEGLFNYLETRCFLPECKTLDLFAGLGSIGIEFLSRGAPEVHFVEQNPKLIQYIRKFLAQTPIEKTRYFLYTREVTHFLEKETPQAFDIIFMDPPYDFLQRSLILHRLLRSSWLKEGSYLILEHRSGEFFKNLPGYQETRKYGSSSFSVFIKSGEN